MVDVYSSNMLDLFDLFFQYTVFTTYASYVRRAGPFVFFISFRGLFFNFVGSWSGKSTWSLIARKAV